jgi:Uma2 family endonuclease
MVQTLTKEITLEDFLQQLETKPAREYIDHHIYTKPMPQGQHSTIQGELVTTINSVTKKQQIAWAFPELRCTFADKSIVPDIAVFTWDHLPVNDDGTIGDRFNIPPDWIIEILSPDQSMTLVTKKILYCLNNGSLMGWIIDPKEKVIFTYISNSLPQFFEENNDLIPVSNFISNWQINLGEIFTWLKVR